MKCEHHTRDIKFVIGGMRWCSRCGAMESLTRVPGKVGSEWRHPTHVEYTGQYRRQPWANDERPGVGNSNRVIPVG